MMAKLLVVLAVVFPIVPLPTYAPRVCWEALRDLTAAVEVAAPDTPVTLHFRTEVCWTRIHWDEVRDCPPLAACDELPPHSVCCLMHRHVGRVLQWLEHAQHERLHWDLTDTFSTARHYQWAWGLACEATNPKAWWYQRRLAMKGLQPWVGGTCMTSYHSYPKVLNLGHKHLAGIFSDPVIVEEKIDGSQFSFCRDINALHMRSKGQEIVEGNEPNMFLKAIEWVRANVAQLQPGWTYRCEYLEKPKHNTLAYDRTPVNHLIGFDINIGEEDYLESAAKAAEFARIGLECVPCLFSGIIHRAAELVYLLERTSCLGGPKIEGVVVKNYKRLTPDGKVMIGKHVSEGFKEVNGATHVKPTRADILTALAAQYATEARWCKAVQHLRDSGTLLGSPQDIGPLMREIHADVIAECSDEIKTALFKWAWKGIACGLTRGFPEWYKKRYVE